MSDPYLGEIRMFGGNYAPQYWNFCDGTLLNVSDYNALFALIGTTYGGDGVTKFALPDLRGRLPIGQGLGQNPVLTNRTIGQKDGKETVSLGVTQIPPHTHTVNASSAAGTQPGPANGVWASLTVANQFITTAEVKSPSITAAMNAVAIANSNGGALHDNMMPYFPLSFIISLQGYFPDRNP